MSPTRAVAVRATAPVTTRIRSRSNEDWLSTLRGESQDLEAAADLSRYLRGAIVRATRGAFGEDDLDDLVQEGLTRVVAALGSFRGDSRFTTWAAGVAVRTAFTELRRRRVRDRVHESFDLVAEEALEVECPSAPRPPDVVEGRQLVEALRAAIQDRLTDRQRTAVLAELRGIPTVEIARRLETNQNALYKLVHDARKKLRAALIAAGFSEESIHHDAWGTHR